LPSPASPVAVTPAPPSPAVLGLAWRQPAYPAISLSHPTGLASPVESQANVAYMAHVRSAWFCDWHAAGTPACSLAHSPAQSGESLGQCAAWRGAQRLLQLLALVADALWEPLLLLLQPEVPVTRTHASATTDAAPPNRRIDFMNRLANALYPFCRAARECQDAAETTGASSLAAARLGGDNGGMADEKRAALTSAQRRRLRHMGPTVPVEIDVARAFGDEMPTAPGMPSPQVLAGLVGPAALGVVVEPELSALVPLDAVPALAVAEGDVPWGTLEAVAVEVLRRVDGAKSAMSIVTGLDAAPSDGVRILASFVHRGLVRIVPPLYGRQTDVKP
jgi:hypothetical protein